MADVIGIGVAGAGGISHSHLLAYRGRANRDLARVVAIADIDEARAKAQAAQYGIERTYTSFDEMLADPHVQAVSICTPPFLHVEQASAALRAGKHVICEKPVSATLAGLDAIADAERAGGAIFAGVFQHRVGQGARQVKALIDAGRFGSLRFGIAETLWQRGQDYYDVWWRGTWEQECGGATMGQAIHSIDMLCWLLGEPVSVIAEAATVKLNIEVEDTSAATVRFRNGALGQIVVTVNAQDNRSRLEIFGDSLQAIAVGDAYDPTRPPFAFASIDPADAEAAAAEAQSLFPDETKYLHVEMVERLPARDHRRPPAARDRRRVPPLDGADHRHVQVGHDRPTRRLPDRTRRPVLRADPAAGLRASVDGGGGRSTGVKIRIGPATTDRANFIGEATLPSLPGDGAWEMHDAETEETQPAQLDDVTGTPRVTWYIKELRAGATREYELRRTEEPAKAPGIELHDQPENGRTVVYYGGLLQTIYHYGMPNYRPRFAPNVAPSGRAGSGVGSTDGSQPKSITDDGPPDHTWHRSLWYACGDLNGVDFYLEPAAMNAGYGPHVGTGYGRIVHRSFDWMTSGPVWGGFQQRAQWVAPDGTRPPRRRAPLPPVPAEGPHAAVGHRSGVHPARRAGHLRSDERERPAADARRRHHRRVGRRHDVTLDRRHRLTAVPRAARRMGGLQRPVHARAGAGAGDLRHRHADHPSNRNHPNAWFVRGYGPVGTNLPYFDGALTLDRGETWTLRHRLYIHQGYAAEAGVAARFEEYAQPVTATTIAAPAAATEGP